MPLDLEGVQAEDVIAGEDIPAQDNNDENEVEDESTDEEVVEENEEDVIQESDSDIEDLESQAQDEAEEEETNTTDEEETTSEKEQPQTRVVDEVGKAFGVEVDEETPDTVEGMRDVFSKAVEEQVEQRTTKFFEEQVPEDVRDYAQFRMNGGDKEEFRENYIEQPSYNDIEITEDNVETQRDLLRQHLSHDPAFDDEDIQEEIQDAESAGTLKKRAERAKKSLSKRQEEKRQEMVEKQEKQAKEQQEQLEEQWNDIENTIEESDSFQGINVPESEKDDFFEWMYETDDDGLTQRDKQLQDTGLETHLAVDWLLYNDFDLSEIAKNVAESEQTQSLSERLSGNSSNRDVSDKRTKKERRKSSSDNVDVDEIEDLQLAAS